MHQKLKLTMIRVSFDQVLRPYSKSSLTLNEWRFNLSFFRVSMLFFNSWRVSGHIARYDTSSPAIQKQQWHSEKLRMNFHSLSVHEWAFRIRALVWPKRQSSNFNATLLHKLSKPACALLEYHVSLTERMIKHSNCGVQRERPKTWTRLL
jgi:hypothetical protein